MNKLMQRSNSMNGLFPSLFDMDDVFSRFLAMPIATNNTNQAGMTVLNPRLDIAETEKTYLIEAELPGVDESEIETTLHDGLLTIRAEKKSSTEEKDKNYHRVERTYGMFQRIVQLPSEIEEDSIEAEFKNGVLKIEIPKSKEAVKEPRKIELKKSKK